MKNQNIKNTQKMDAEKIRRNEDIKTKLKT